MFARKLHNGNVPWSTTDNLLADLWVLTLQAHTNDPDKTPDDHPARYALGEAERLERQQQLRAKFEARKAEYARRKAARRT